MRKLIECVPNISEGQNPEIYNTIANVVETVDGVKLLDVDPGAATNRTVITFVGEPEQVIEAAFLLIKKSNELIDMSKHKGEHPRFGATDVCPLIPIANITMEETAKYAHKLGKKVGEELNLSGYFYENAATKEERKNLATVRSGEYEGLTKKLADDNWKPDFGPATFNEKFGCIAISARDFLVAYNINLNTTSVRKANSVAFDVRENGRVKRTGNPITGKKVVDENGNTVREPGMLKAVKGIGWYIEEYGIAQVSMNLTNISITSIHEAFEACRKSANNRGMRVTGSEVIGLVPKKSLIDAGKFYLKKQGRSTGIEEREIIKIAAKSMGFDDLAPFDMDKKVIEYVLEGQDNNSLNNLTINKFATETASESPAPGGGSIAAYVGSLGIALGTMVANLSANKRGWDDRIEEFSDVAEQGQTLMDELLFLVDEDTNAFNKIIDAVRLPKSTDEEKTARKTAMDNATKYAIEVPLKVMQKSFDCYAVLENMATKGNPNSASDAGVGALCINTAIQGAFLNVKINLKDFEDQSFKTKIMEEANLLSKNSIAQCDKIVALVDEVIS